MNDDLFLKKMKGVKPLNKSNDSIKNLDTKNKTKKNETKEKSFCNSKQNINKQEK